MNQTPLYVRKIIKHALLMVSTSIAISHNHPNGDAQPSSSDMSLIRQLAEAGQKCKNRINRSTLLSHSTAILVLRRTSCYKSFYSYSHANVLKRKRIKKLLENPFVSPLIMDLGCF
ncbi:MAG: JAB domain-containing protein [Wolbachia sp.]